jgi:hypothetical protein
LKLTNTPKLLSFIIFFSAFIPTYFSADILVLDRSKLYFSIIFVCWKFSVYTQKISVTFLGVLQLFQQAFACCFCRAASYLEVHAAYNTWEASKLALLELG